MKRSGTTASAPIWWAALGAGRYELSFVTGDIRIKRCVQLHVRVIQCVNPH